MACSCSFEGAWVALAAFHAAATPTLSFSSSTIRSAVFAQSTDLGENSYVRIHDSRLEIPHTHSAKYGQTKLRPDAADIVDKKPKQIAFGRGHESVERVRVLSNVKMRENSDRLPDSRQLVIAGKRNEQLVSNAIHIHDGLSRERGREEAFKKRDHVEQSVTDDPETANSTPLALTPASE
jgi:hypothetical protein